MTVSKCGSLVCHQNLHCSQWASLYLKYCLCSAKDGVSLSLGLISVLSWGVAEVPQIITNYREKTTEGLSLAFLTTWILGDLFNLAGCLLEPATLPTQYYMAVLYTINSLILLAQMIYYGRIYHQVMTSRLHHKVVLDDKNEENNNDYGWKVVNHADENPNESSVGAPQSSPIPVTVPAVLHNSLPGRESYYKSARFLSRSYNSAVGSPLAQRTTRSAFNSWNSVEEPLIGGGLVSAQYASPSNTKTMLCMISAFTFFLSNYNLYLSASNSFHTILEKPNQGVVIGARRSLFKVSGSLSPESIGEKSSGIGTLLGWAMAALYMGGRLPQICLNIRRGDVQGLSLCMFICALVGNVTYITSILVNSLDWSKIQPNLPWLADAGGCALLDTFILIQFMYFYYRAPRDKEDKHANSIAA